MSTAPFQHPKDQIVEFMQRIYGYGMTTTSGGNLSIMDDNGDMWISPASIDKGALTRDDIVCVKADGTIIGRHKPSSEYPFHSAVYKMRHDVRALLHAHPPALVSFSVAGKIPDTHIHPTMKAICGNVGYAGYEVPGSEALGKNVAAAFAAGHNTILLENHGACCVGASLMQAFQRFETLDYCARILLNATKLGTPHLLSETDLDFHAIDRNAMLRPFIPDTHSSEEKEMRFQMVKFIRRAYRQKLFTSTEGTFAIRLSNNDFLITPSGIDRGTLLEDDLVLIRGNSYEAGKTPSAATWFFKEILDRQPEINSLIISNPPYLMGYAVSHVDFDPRVIPESYLLLREMPTFPFCEHMHHIDNVATKISPRYPVIILQNDCLVTSGATLLQAFDRMEVAEYSAKATINALGLGGMKPITGEQIQDLIKAFNLLP